jgi:hypothetical protein
MADDNLGGMTPVCGPTAPIWVNAKADPRVTGQKTRVARMDRLPQIGQKLPNSISEGVARRLGGRIVLEWSMAVSRIGFALFGCVIAGLAAVFALNEYRAFLQWSLPTEDLLASAGESPLMLAPAKSIRTEDEQMSACLYAIQWVQYFPQSEARAHAIATGCRARAGEILDRSPTRSIAHLVQAFAASQIGTPDETLEALRRSAATGQREGWLAVERLGLAMSLAAQKADDDDRAALLDVVAADVVTLATENALAKYAAGQYVRYPEFQDWIIQLIETQPPDVQRRFLGWVRAVQQGASGS